MVMNRGRWSSASTSVLLGVRVPQGDNLRLALLRKQPSYFRQATTRELPSRFLNQNACAAPSVDDPVWITANQECISSPVGLVPKRPNVDRTDQIPDEGFVRTVFWEVGSEPFDSRLS